MQRHSTFKMDSQLTHTCSSSAYPLRLSYTLHSPTLNSPLHRPFLPYTSRIPASPQLYHTTDSCIFKLSASRSVLTTRCTQLHFELTLHATPRQYQVHPTLKRHFLHQYVFIFLLPELHLFANQPLQMDSPDVVI